MNRWAMSSDIAHRARPEPDALRRWSLIVAPAEGLSYLARLRYCKMLPVYIGDQQHDQGAVDKQRERVQHTDRVRQAEHGVQGCQGKRPIIRTLSGSKRIAKTLIGRGAPLVKQKNRLPAAKSE